MIVAGSVVLGFSPTESLGEDRLVANVQVEHARFSGPSAADAPASVSSISLTASFAAGGDGDAPSFDVLRGATGSARFAQLEFWVRDGDALDEQGMRALVRAVLRREQLAWALARGVLGLSHGVRDDRTGEWSTDAYISSGQIRSVLAARSASAVDDGPPALDDDEYAEFLSLFFEQKRDEYSRRLPALRAERAVAKARSSEEISRLPGTCRAGG
ncbi:hypothetical protein PsYK624_130630 [Phanerochaete sordida]|uniref:Uncharacterized protein n=1 Tax=Phanerochaete sordida TaxID=48140 RepID=A0A9P3GLB5_9APHY|nr:hypothetical protein PsYK624_130630 [Phanerochaete sordida]